MAKRTLRTKLCEMLDIEYPICLAGMQPGAGPELAAAVSNAGGLGVLGATTLTTEEMRDWIRKTKSLTDKPFGVDILMPVVPESGTVEAFKAEVPAEYAAFAEKMREGLGLPGVTVPERVGLTVEELRKVVEVIVEERPAVFAAGLGSPEWVIPKMHSRGIKVISLVGNVKNARRVAERGADIVMAQGHEAGGHTGRIGTLALVPQVVDAVRPLPVVAGGGIGDGRGLVAALALGAAGVWVGTRFLCTPEAMVDHYALSSRIRSDKHPDYWKQRMVEATEEDTIVSRLYTGKTCRMLKNRFIEAWDKAGGPYLTMPLQGMLVSKLQAGFREAGWLDCMFSPTGQITGMIKEIKPAGEVVTQMVEEACEILERLPGVLTA